MFVGTSRRVITDGDVVAAAGVAETGVCVVLGAAVVVDAAAEGVATGFAVAVGETEDDSDALPRVAVVVGGALVCDAVGFAVVAMALCVVTDGCADAPLGTFVAGGAAAAWGVMPIPSAMLAIRRNATTRRKPVEKRCRCVWFTYVFPCKPATVPQSSSPKTPSRQY